LPGQRSAGEKIEHMRKASLTTRRALLRIDAAHSKMAALPE
jgi:hypothetical protein